MSVVMGRVMMVVALMVSRGRRRLRGITIDFGRFVRRPLEPLASRLALLLELGGRSLHQRGRSVHFGFVAAARSSGEPLMLAMLADHDVRMLAPSLGRLGLLFALMATSNADHVRHGSVYY